MAQEPNFQDDPYLAARLGEARDVADFSRHRPPAGSASVEREMELPGAEHLGGRQIRDRFVRSGQAPPPPPAPKRKLEPHLEALLATVEDSAPAFRTTEADPLERYRALRRRLGGA